MLEHNGKIDLRQMEWDNMNMICGIGQGPLAGSSKHVNKSSCSIIAYEIP